MAESLLAKLKELDTAMELTAIAHQVRSDTATKQTLAAKLKAEFDKLKQDVVSVWISEARGRASLDVQYKDAVVASITWMPAPNMFCGPSGFGVSYGGEPVDLFQLEDAPNAMARLVALVRGEKDWESAKASADEKEAPTKSATETSASDAAAGADGAESPAPAAAAAVASVETASASSS